MLIFDPFKSQRPSPRESPAGAPVLPRLRAAPTSSEPKNRLNRRNTNVTNSSNRARTSDLKIWKSAISLLRAPRRSGPASRPPPAHRLAARQPRKVANFAHTAFHELTSDLNISDGRERSFWPLQPHDPASSASETSREKASQSD
jgi:hypothetical protein